MEKENVMLKFEVTGGDIEYLQNVVKAGKAFETKKFFELPEIRKSEILGETFRFKLVTLLRARYGSSEISFNAEKGQIKLLKRVKIEVTEGLYKKDSNVSINPLTFSEFSLEGGYLTCRLTFNPEALSYWKIISLLPKSSYKGTASYEVVTKFDDVSSVDVWKEKALKCNMKIEFSKEKLLMYFFDTLHVKRLTEVSGSEAVHLSKIYTNAVESFPTFDSLWLSDQVRILNEGYFTTRVKAPNQKENQDIYVLGRFIFEVMRKENLHTVIDKDGYRYHLVKEHKMDRGIDGKIFERNALVWSEYIYKVRGLKFSRGFCIGDLWNFLSSGNTITSLEEVI